MWTGGPDTGGSMGCHTELASDVGSESRRHGDEQRHFAERVPGITLGCIVCPLGGGNDCYVVWPVGLQTQKLSKTHVQTKGLMANQPTNDLCCEAHIADHRPLRCCWVSC